MTTTNDAAPSVLLQAFNPGAVADGRVCLDAMVAYDAIAEGRSHAHLLLAGLPCTVSIGSAHMAGVVVSATDQSILVKYGRDEKPLRFRDTRRGFTAKRGYTLYIGEAETRFAEEM